MPQEHIIVAEKDPALRRTLAEALSGRGRKVSPVSDGAKLMEELEQNRADLVVSALDLPVVDGMKLLEALAKEDSYVPVILLTPSGRVEEAVEAMKKGAFYCLPKPVNLAELKDSVERALAERKKAENRALAVPVVSPFPSIIGRSAKMQEVFETIVRVAPTDVTVLISGESGTGKELVADAIVQRSARASKPYVKVHCAALSEGVLESELFGHERGAFTGAVSRHLGRFERANHGSLFLDEITEIPLSIQVKLLRVLQDGSFERVGGTESLKTDVRLICATNQDLEQAVAEKRFRDDLYWRINVIRLHLPPLRERREDIPLMVKAFIREFAEKNRREVQGISPEALEILQDYPWPGNVRELRNVLEGMVVLARGKVLSVSDLPSGIRNRPPGEAQIMLSVGTTIDKAERELIRRTLASTKGDLRRAAKLLGIGVKALRSKMKGFGIEE
jgi:DNA-binding NtrC family response regulator